MTMIIKTTNTDPLSHLRALPEYPEGTRVAVQDERFWAAKNSDGSVCVFVDGIQARNLLQLGEILPSIFLHVDQLRVSRGIFTLTEVSLVEKFLTVFVAIANDAKEISDADVCDHIKKEILEWSAFLSPRRTGITDEKLRGLWGELYVLQNFICGRFSPRESLRAYIGIHDAPQDLSGHDFSIEVKTTISRAPSTVSISSLEQLDANCPHQLLVLLALVGSDDGVSVSDLVDEITDILGADVRVAMQFQRLVHAALDGATEAQLDERFYPANLSAWEVTADFPALRRSDVNGAVLRADYSLAIQQLSDFLMTQDIGDWIDGL